MSNIIPFDQSKPDAEFIRVDDSGVNLYRYALEYEMSGKKWAAYIWAYSFEDAQNRTQAMKASLVLVGQTYSEI